MTGRLGGPIEGWWEFPATVVQVLDGDTVRCDLDLGLRTTRTEAVRLDGIDAPEKSTQAGVAAREHLVALLPEGAPVTVFTKKPDKYGRVLGRIVVPRSDRLGTFFGDVGQHMIDAGHARPYDGGRR